MSIRIGEELRLRHNKEIFKATVIMIETKPMIDSSFGVSLKIIVHIPETNQLYAIHGIDKQFLDGVTIGHLERVPLENEAWRKLNEEERRGLLPAGN